MDKYYFQDTPFPGVWELGTLDPIPLNKISEHYTKIGQKFIRSDRRIRELMDFLGFKYRPRHAKNPQRSNKTIGPHVDMEDYFLVCNPTPKSLKTWPWMVILTAADDSSVLGTKIRKYYSHGYLDVWRIYLIHRCVIHDSPEDQQNVFRIMNRYDIHQFPEPKCLHNYRRKLRDKHIAIAKALLKG